MSKDNTENILMKAFPFLENTSRSTLDKILRLGFFKKIPDGQILIYSGDTCQYLPLVLEGSLRVYKIGKNANEITLYYIEKGESCILTLTSILNCQNFPAIATTNGQSSVFFVPSELLKKLVELDTDIRKFVFSLYSSRIMQVISLVDEVVFNKLDTRVVDFLLNRQQKLNSNIIKNTHQEIADEIGTSREVVSRILKNIEEKGYINLTRGQIIISRQINLKKYKENS